MKKTIICLAALLCLTLGFTSCEKESAGLTTVTYYAQLTLNGEEEMVVAKGSEFVDPGCVAVMQGEDVSDQIKVTGSVDTSTSGVYTLTYSIVNKDGFPASASRTVVVLDLNSAIEGFWACTPTSFRLNANTGDEVAYGAPFEILIIDNGDGTILVDDLLAGWYCQRVGYGTNYAMQANLAVAADGTLSLLGSYVPGWGDAADLLEDGKFDEAAQTITYKVTYAGYLVFNVTLNKVEVEL